MRVVNDSDIHQLPYLSNEEARRRIQREGYNEIPSQKSGSTFSILIHLFSEPLFLLLIAGGILYLILGSVKEASMLMSFVIFIMAITFYQERKTELALKALRHLASPRALVIRDGQEIRIPGREVVREDIIVLHEGDCIPADAVLLTATHLSVDESILTGESFPVEKTVQHDKAIIYSGTLVVQGYGIARVLAVGLNTEMGKIGKCLETLKPEPTSLQKDTRRLIRNFAVMGFFLCAAVAVLYALTLSNWVQGLLAGITLAMAILPEEFSVVLVIFLSLGAWRIAKQQVLTRRLPAVEALGAATILCSDKTGTITLNQMTVTDLYAEGEFYHLQREILPEKFHALFEYSILASQRDPFDPMEKAIRQLGEHYLDHTEHWHRDWIWVRQYPLSQELLSISQVWQSPDYADYVIAAKGAPEAITDLCHWNQSQIAQLNHKISHLAGQGLRVLGVAKANFRQPHLPKGQHDFEFQFIGLMGLTDPIRPGVFEAIQDCYHAGVRVIMTTGDYPETAQHIASQIGLRHPEIGVTGYELNKMSDLELQQKIQSVNIFSRIVPEQKLRLVNALKAHREIVAMTGDGVNDAPALKAAHIGIAMGARGTDVARESASLVLLNDDFSSIVEAIRLGRRVFDNIKKAFAYILAIHIPIAGISFLPVLLKWPLILLPSHIVFLELIIDPACSIVFESEPEEAGTMMRPPRDSHKPLFSGKTVLFSLLQGLSVLIVLFVMILVCRHVRCSTGETRAMIFTALVIANMGLILTNRSYVLSVFRSLKTPNRALWIVMGCTLVLLGATLSIPWLERLFYFSPLSGWQWVVSFMAGLFSVAWSDWTKSKFLDK